MKRFTKRGRCLNLIFVIFKNVNNIIIWEKKKFFKDVGRNAISLIKIHLTNSYCFHVLKKAFSNNEQFLLGLTVYPYFSLFTLKLIENKI